MTPEPAPDGPVRITLIVARARNGVIGAGNSMPWHLPEELGRFKAVTIGHALIMGRKTFESIGRPLPGRRIVVVTRNAQWQHEGCIGASSLDDALEKACQPDDIVEHPDEVFIAGGAQLYAQALPIAHRLLITEVDLAPQGDVFFDAPDPARWDRIASDTFQSSAGCGYRIDDWRRLPG